MEMPEFLLIVYSKGKVRDKNSGTSMGSGDARIVYLFFAIYYKQKLLMLIRLKRCSLTASHIFIRKF